MPIFEFKCKRCEKEFEFLMLKKDEKVVCVFCGFEDCEKLISTFRTGGYDGGKLGGSSSSSVCSSCSSKNCSTCR